MPRTDRRDAFFRCLSIQKATICSLSQKENPTMYAKKTVLIAEDNSINRHVLKNLLSADYTVMEAEDGAAALQLLRGHSAEIAAVLLDLFMPVMDGFAFLEAIRNDDALQGIPVLVVTGSSESASEVRALELGAWDFVTKPYDAEIIKFRLRGAIERSQLAAFNMLRYLSEYDSLTGIFNKAKFFETTRRMLTENPNAHFAFVRLDIDRFQLVNAFFGMEEGDRLLRHIAECLKTDAADPLYTIGRMEADVFAMCFAYTGEAEALARLHSITGRIKAFNRTFDIVPTFGVYFPDDLSMSIDVMLDRASLATRTVKGRYTDTIAFYKPEMSRRLEQEQEIINEMADALESGQFCVYLQPKYALESNTLCGAEALVRWQHPKKGLVPPGDFIPIFEKNGFISKLDYFVWELVCRLLRRWLDEGLSPHPVSVNVSRVNFYNPQIVESIHSLVEKYELPPHLLELELTESAYTDNPAAIQSVVRRLHEKGFSVSMDDFGSGYSSLGILKDIEVDTLKIDMRFFANTHIAGRGENIIASVIRMAKWLGLPTLAEGAETAEQVNFLRSVGCSFVQGFYFARPLPVAEYEVLMRQSQTVESPAAIFSSSAFDIDAVWRSSPEIELLFSSSPQAYAIYEYDGTSLEILRFNHAFTTEISKGEDIHLTMPLSYVFSEDRETVFSAFHRCLRLGQPEACIYRRLTGQSSELRWISLHLQFLYNVGERHIFLGSLRDISVQKKLESELLHLNATMRLQGTQTTHEDILLPLLAESENSRQHIYTVKEVSLLLRLLRAFFDTVRIVDPAQTALVFFREDDTLLYERETCFAVWGKTERCKDCTSLCALKTGKRYTKPEPLHGSMLSVLSSPLTVRDSTGKEHRLVLEIAAYATDYLPNNRFPFFPALIGGEDSLYIDALTGFYNRRYVFDMRFLQKPEFSVGNALAFVLVDIVNLRQINNAFGHAIGDTILADTAAALSSAVRQTDCIVHFSGSELLIMLCGCSAAERDTVLSHIREVLHSISFGNLPDSAVQTAISFAAADSFDGTQEALELLLKEASLQL